MKMTAKLLSVLLCAAMLISLLPVTASAAVLGDLQYEVRDDHVVITLCKNTATSVDIPDQINGLPVTEIGDSAFDSCKSLKSVTIPSSVTTIGGSAFFRCYDLENITIPSSVTTIDRYAFSWCSALTSVTIPISVTSIGEYAFSSCSALTNISIPSSVTSIGNNAFLGSGYYNDTKNWKNGVLYIGDWLIKADEDTIPSNYTVTSGTRGIADNAFSGCAWLESVTIPNGVTSIGGRAFLDCSALTSVTIPNGVTSIGEFAFDNCSALTNVTIPNSVTSIGEFAFDDCSALKNVTIPSGVMNIDRYAFSGCSALTSVTILNGVKNIDEYAFFYCSVLTSVTIPSSVASIGEHAFDGCNNLSAVYYGGSEAQWRNIDIGSSNFALRGATIHYLGTDEGDPTPPVIEYPYTINGLSLVSVNGEALAAPPSDLAFMVNVKLKETKSRSTQDYLFVAVYDTRGALLSLDYVRANFTYNSGLEFGFYVPAQTRKIGSIKAFVWNGFNTEQPLCESVEIKN